MPRHTPRERSKNVRKLPGTSQPTTRRDRRRLNAVTSANRQNLMGDARKSHIKTFETAAKKAGKATRKASRRKRLNKSAERFLGR